MELGCSELGNLFSPLNPSQPLPPFVSHPIFPPISPSSTWPFLLPLSLLPAFFPPARLSPQPSVSSPDTGALSEGWWPHDLSPKVSMAGCLLKQVGWGPSLPLSLTKALRAPSPEDLSPRPHTGHY